MMSVICYKCGKIYSKQSNLNRHLSEYHDESISYDQFMHSFQCLEDNCKSSFKRNADLRYHLSEIHGICMEEDQMEFNNLEEFQTWLNNVQQKHAIEYVQPRGRFTSKDKQTVYFNCNRSGKSRQVANQSKRLSKASSKIGISCTSQIILIIRDDKCVISFFKTHYGHEIEIQHLHLPKEHRVLIAKKLSDGIPPQRIVHTNRDNFDSTKLKRTDLLTLKDIHNIKKSFNIDVQEGVRHREDAISVDSYVQECQQLQDNPIIGYKRQNEEHEILRKEDFLIVIMNLSQEEMLKKFGNNIIAIDSTHGLNAYDFQLTTVLVVDEWGEGFPTACMLTNREDSLIFEYLFKLIKSKVGLLQPKTFMSDMTNVFYNAWVSVMGPAENRLFCAWHVDRAWQKNLNKIVDAETRTVVYNSLKILQKTVDENEFHKLLLNIVDMMCNDKDTVRFGSYFRENYVRNYKLWAYCYRKTCGIKTNMRLESMHKTIKYVYLNAKKVKRLDKGLHALNKFIRDKIVDRIIKHTKGKHSKHIQDIHTRHKKAENDLLVLKFSSENDYVVCSGDKQYNISKVSDGTCCKLVCSTCNVCIHSYSCTCPDYFIQSTFCKHIHFVLQRNKNLSSVQIPCTSGSSSNSGDVEIDLHLKTLTYNSQTKTAKKRDILIETISKKCDTLKEIAVKSQNIEVLSRVSKTLETESHLLSADVNISPFKGNYIDIKEPPNKKITKQNTFVTTKKTKKIKTKGSKTFPSQRSETLKSIMLNNEIFISQSAEHDHTY